MISFIYEGVKYIRYDDCWCDEHYMTAPLCVQSVLDRQYADSLDLKEYDSEELLKLADEFKKNQSYHLAIRYYYEVIRRVDIGDCSYIYPRLSACYRKVGRAREAIELMTFLKNKFGVQSISAVLLTSVAAAYCDLLEYDNALKCANRAYVLMGKRTSPELSLVYRRINSNMKTK